jgi:hypothetical protein
MLSLACAATYAADPVTIQVVHTWKELADTPEVKLSTRTMVRVGIEALTAPKGSSVLLYVLSSDIPQHGAVNNVGPLKLTVDPQSESNAKEMVEVQSSVPSNAFALFCAVINIDEIKTTVSLSDGNMVIASATVVASDRTFHPWMAFNMSLRDKNVIEGEIAAVRLRNTSAVASPAIKSYEPAYIVSARTLLTDSLLPHLLTSDDVDQEQNASGKLKSLVMDLGADVFDIRDRASRALRRSGLRCIKLLRKERVSTLDAEIGMRLDNLITEAEENIQAKWSDGAIWLTFPIQVQPEELFVNLAARWWVNGQPVTVSQPNGEEMQSNSMPFQAVSSVVVRIDLDLGLLGAAPGDRIEMQCMYAPNGHMGRAVKKSDAQNALLICDKEGPIPCVSNRVQFTAP